MIFSENRFPLFRIMRSVILPYHYSPPYPPGRTNITLPRIAIATGDPAGIGPEIALKAALDARVKALCRPLLVGDPAVVELHAKAAGLTPRLHVVGKAADADWSNGAVNLLDAGDGANVPVIFGKRSE